MTIFAIDDRSAPLRELEGAIRKTEPDANVYSFSNGREALEFAKTVPEMDVAFIDIEMPEMDGLELARRMKIYYPRINIIFVTAFPNYANDAFALHASGYVAKPVTPEDVRRELDDLRHPVAVAPKRVRIQTFGNFEVYIDEKPVAFRRDKTKEYLAYLVDRGTLCSNAEIIAALWPNEISASYFRNIRKDLFDTFHASGCGDVLIRQSNKQGIRADKVNCDYYDWKRGLPWALNAYRGEYMSQYEWAELTHGALE